MFFFSSRRRHTRWPRDWSSDVCSSDLFPIFCCHSKKSCEPHPKNGTRTTEHNSCSNSNDITCTNRCSHRCHKCLERSEERRVGKECRSRWVTLYQIKRRRTTKGTEEET